MENWPAHTSEERAWKSSGRAPREDRELSKIDVSIPPHIAELSYYPSHDTMVLLETAAIKIAALDATAGAQMAAISGFLLRSESVSSSKIEHVEANREDYAKAMIGIKSSANARSMVAATDAIQAMITAAGKTGAVGQDAMLVAHGILMKDDPTHAHYAGRIRDVQNWIKGSDYSPRGAIHIPPPPDLVPALLDDLFAFANRTNIPVLAQAAITHAQFESIHPFTDGNGRIGRALIGAVSRRRGLTSTTVTPIASAMVADVKQYFSLVNNYRAGEVDAFVGYLAESAIRATDAAKVSIAALQELPDMWTDMARPRRNSADEKIIARLLERPVFEAHTAAHFAGVKENSIYAALDRLVDSGVLSLVSSAKRNRAWAATEVLDEVDRLNKRLGFVE
ncbi:DNA-binding protein [Arthrobacter alpinus]|uniref:DNA-binding protein n=1 Tax=Arthrobacter alpinus TaxID=656366 RepID=A0A0M4QZ31_9MICC|nr:Fic family protein [Arthrobacter alpinus]ALE93761.1 DNA-binding protein [Arthrobacter alpinus]